jgi:hypothetical protein
MYRSEIHSPARLVPLACWLAFGASACGATNAPAKGPPSVDPRAEGASHVSQEHEAPSPSRSTDVEDPPESSPAHDPPNAGEAPAPETEVAEPSPSDGFRLEDGRAPDLARALPRFQIRHLGMHIGGESNSDASKQPWLRAIERQEVALLRCYRLVTQPAVGGTLGVDLFVTSSGGGPEVRKVRQKLGDDSFESCVRSAFEGVRFARPERPTVLSYSLRFDIQGLR